MKLVAVLAMIAAAAAVAVWRSRTGAEVWHVAPDAPSANQGP
ncbi:hypothetical protein SAMN04489835_1392 [Mycolicibacterium rutilum]|uniref:Uncharacterized protein n=1 Tax=Mycolicibacterium rutilum TaxID=370526 RepID=A0A1H6J4U6_MYCRU|nr:hypothetical protein [Mycolicibacterium rutilum]SEH55730.1 hypothetical protein SAMN04489835_1392 [Mycolicibacterium rutilum]